MHSQNEMSFDVNVYESLRLNFFSYLLGTNTFLKLMSTNIFYHTWSFVFVMEQIKVKVGSRLHILIWSWRWINNLYFVTYNFLYSQTPGMLDTQAAKKENCISHFTMHTEIHIIFGFWFFPFMSILRACILKGKRNKIWFCAEQYICCTPVQQKNPTLCSLTCCQVCNWIQSHVYFHKNEKPGKQAPHTTAT